MPVANSTVGLGTCIKHIVLGLFIPMTCSFHYKKQTKLTKVNVYFLAHQVPGGWSEHSFYTSMTLVEFLLKLT